MCQETTYTFKSQDCRCVYIHIVTCEDARIPVDVAKDARKRWPKCRGRRGVKRVDGGVLGVGCWELGEEDGDGLGEMVCEKRLVFLDELKVFGMGGRLG